MSHIRGTKLHSPFEREHPLPVIFHADGRLTRAMAMARA